MNNPRDSRRWVLLSLTLLGTLVLVTLTLMVAASAGEIADSDLPTLPTAGLIRGTVTDPGGELPPAGTRVKLWKPDGSLAGQAMVAAGTGSFSLGPAPNGNYVLRAVPPEPSPLTPSFPKVILVAGSPVDAGTIPLTRPGLTGTVRTPDGSTPAEAWVGVYRIDGQLVEGDWAPAGDFRIEEESP